MSVFVGKKRRQAYRVEVVRKRGEIVTKTRARERRKR